MVTYSHSRLNCFENCPKQYYFRYVERIQKEREEGIEAFLGSRVHEALEKLYTDKKMLKENTLDDVLEYYHSEWHKNWHENVKIVKKEYKPDNYYKLGLKYLTNYYKKYEPFDDAKTIALEQKLFFDMDGYKITGYIDRLSQREDGTYEIHDYKTNSSLPEQAHFDEDRQLALYNIGVKGMWDDAKNTELIWHFLAFDKEMKSTRSEKQLNELKDGVVSLIHTIEKAEEKDAFPANESALCKWCDYQNECPKYAHVAKTNQMSLNKFMKEPGVKLVNEYRDLSEQKKMIEEELLKVKEAVIKYSLDNDVVIIRGSDRKLSVKVEDYVDVPTKTTNPDEYVELEALLRKSESWKDVSSINASLLRNALDGNAFKTDLQNKIAKLLVQKHSETVRLSKLKDE